ncbi:MAG: alpha/beta fold hydrolase [Bacillota bacterium]
MGLYVKQVRPDCERTVVLIHGGGVSGWMWRPQVETLNDYHCLVPDLAEHGMSISVKPFSIKESAEQIAEIIRQQAHGGRADVVVLSIGGQIVAELLANAPDVLDHAIISGALSRALPGYRLTSALGVASLPLSKAGWMIRASLKSLGIPPEFELELADDTRATTAEGFRRIMEAVGTFALSSKLRETKVPTLVVVGEKEQKISIQSAREYVAMIPNAAGRMAPQVGHMWNMQNPGLFTRMIRSWVTDQPLPSEMKPLQ